MPPKVTAKAAPFSTAAYLFSIVLPLVRIAVTLFGCYTAFEIRTYAIREYGPLIHECVPAARAARLVWCVVNQDGG